MGLRQIVKQSIVSKEIAELIDSIPKPVGSYGFDPWGYKRETIKTALSLLKPVYDHYFRVEAYGLGNIPKQGRLLIIGNHSGQMPIDGALLALATATNPDAPRAARVMIERWFPTLPFVGNYLNELGAVIGDPINCVKMLRNEEVVLVFPEGVRGAGKPFNKRYQLQRFGNGFMHLAMSEATPIMPVGIVGCEETMISIGNIKPLAKMFNMPYFPITLPFPLPAKVILNFGKPMEFTGDISSEEDVIKNVEIVKDAMRDLIDEGLAQRKGWFKGLGKNTLSQNTRF